MGCGFAPKSLDFSGSLHTSDNPLKMRSSVRQKTLQSRTKIADAGLAVGSFNKTILGAVAVAETAMGTRLAIVGKPIAFLAAKLPLLRGIDDVGELPICFARAVSFQV